MFLFLLGKNPEIAKLEVANYLENRFQIKNINLDRENYLEIDFIDNSEFENNSNKVISELGGVLRIAKRIHTDTEINHAAFENLDFYYPKKFNYAISSIGLDESEKRIAESFAKHQIKQFKSKGILQKTFKQVLEPSKFFSSKVNEGFELLIIKDEEIYSFYQTLASTNPKDYEFKDNARPLKVISHGSPFRLAQIMVNILNLNENQTMLDPFCGTGTFLIEGMAKALNVVGIDNDPELIESAKQNVSWAKDYFNFETKVELILGYSQVTDFLADGIVFEPFMGPFLKSEPKKREALQIIKELTDLYTKVFNNISKQTEIGTRVVFIQPSIKTKGNELIHIDDSFYRENNFELLDWKKYFPKFSLTNLIPYKAADGSILYRRLTVLEKIS